MKSEGTDLTGQGDDNGQSIEVLPDGSKSYVLENKPWLYRAYRLRGMYEGTALIPPIPSPIRTSSPDLSTFLGSVALAELNGEDVTSLPLLDYPRDQASYRYDVSYQLPPKSRKNQVRMMFGDPIDQSKTHPFVRIWLPSSSVVKCDEPHFVCVRSIR